jgi:four helix bundle protein
VANGELGWALNEHPINSYRDLRVWQEAMTLAESCYRTTRGFPKDELFGLTSQTRRAAASIAANIAEGHGRENTGSFVQYLRIAQGSLKELETHLLLSERIGLIEPADNEQVLKHCEILGKGIRALIRSLQQKGAST